MWQENIIQWKEETTAGSRISTDRSAYDIQTIVHSLQHSRNVSCLCQCHSKGCEARWAGIFDTFEAYAKILELELLQEQSILTIKQ